MKKRFHRVEHEGKHFGSWLYIIKQILIQMFVFLKLSIEIQTITVDDEDASKTFWVIGFGNLYSFKSDISDCKLNDEKLN